MITDTNLILEINGLAFLTFNSQEFKLGITINIG